MSDKFLLTKIVKSTRAKLLQSGAMGRQLVTLALGLTITRLGRFNDQEIIIRKILTLNATCKDPRNAAR